MDANAGPITTTDDVGPVVEALDPKKARRVIWVVLLILGGLQAWASRYTATPDGMSYVDLSDAIVNGHPGAIVNAYWSPLYPALFGVLRLIVRPGPYSEFSALHFLNWLLFGGSIAAFEYFLRALTVAAARRNRFELTTVPGRAVAYTVFGALSLMMTPLMLPTPDLLVTTASFLVFGALLRLREDPDRRRHAVALGLSLAMGSLAKSFFIPWSAVVLVVAWITTRRGGWRPVATAAATWLLFVGPWIAALSAKQGHATFGDTGRLTYIWNVNQIESPSLKIMPHGATTPASEAALPGVAVMPDAQGSNPVWFDPVRWYSDLEPKWDASQQLATFSSLVSQFFSSLAPILLLIWFALAVARREERATWWHHVWIIGLPAIAAMGAYSLVLVTTRYIAPFLVALFLMVFYLLAWPSRLTPARVLLGLGVPLLIVVSTPQNAAVLSYVNAGLAAVLFAWGFHRRGTPAMVIAGVAGAAAVRVLLPAELRSFGMLGSILILVWFWASARRALQHHQSRQFSIVVRLGLLLTNAAIIAFVFFLKYRASIVSPSVIPGESNANWLVADALNKAGIAPGTRVAVIGSPFEAYWARTGRLQIVGVVPPWRVKPFIGLSTEKQAVLFSEFSRVGARAVISQMPLPPVAHDTSWKPYEYIGWVKRLPGG